MRSQGGEPEDLSSNPGSAADVLCNLGQVPPHPSLSPAAHELGSSLIHVVTHPPALWAPTSCQAGQSLLQELLVQRGHRQRDRK